MKYEIIYSDNLPNGIGGKCYYPWFPKWGTCQIVIRNKYREDKGLLAHELKHVKQYHNNFLHALMYKHSKSYRYKCELKAYTQQIEIYKYTKLLQANWIVYALVNKYSLDISEKNIIEDIELIYAGYQH